MTTTLATLQSRLKTSLGDTNLIYADKYLDAINEAIREITPSLYQPLDDRTLVTGNILPNAHFEDWSTATALRQGWSGTNGTLAQTTTAGFYRGATTSAKITVATAGGYLSLHSDNYPRLLDLMDRTIDFEAWCHPQVANDAFITIYTKQANGTAQTLPSTTTCPAGEFSLLKLESQTLNDDLVEVEFRLGVTTNGNYAYFDDAKVFGHDIYELMLPYNFINGEIERVVAQITGYSDTPCDDLNPRYEDELSDWGIVHDGTNQFLSFGGLHTQGYRLKVVGRKPFDTMDSSADTIPIEDPEVTLLIACAKYKIYDMAEGVASAQDRKNYRERKYEALMDYQRLKASKSMPIKSSIIRL